MDTSELRQMAEELGLTSKHWLHPDFDTNTESEPIEFEEISIPVVERISINMEIDPLSPLLLVIMTSNTKWCL